MKSFFLALLIISSFFLTTGKAPISDRQPVALSFEINESAEEAIFSFAPELFALLSLLFSATSLKQKISLYLRSELQPISLANCHFLPFQHENGPPDSVKA